MCKNFLVESVRRLNYKIRFRMLDSASVFSCKGLRRYKTYMFGNIVELA
jgi:hypothetical protein